VKKKIIKKFIKTIDEKLFFNLLKFVHFYILDFKNIIYNFIKKFFSFLGRDIRFKKINLNFDEIYKKYIKKPIIFDVGANIGSSIKRFDLKFNNCVIHSFEPIKECFDQMVRDYPNKRFIKNNYALGENNINKRFFINKHSVTSSFYKINKIYDETDKNDKPKNSIKTKIMTLDTYINLNKIKKIDILKIDTQGYELSV
jgi:FkbM family methyltransferase